MKLRTCITPLGFRFGVHAPSYSAANLREQGRPESLGLDEQNRPVDNSRNFPDADVTVPRADMIYEIPNAFPFRGTTYIDSTWADSKSSNPALIRLPEQQECSLSTCLQTCPGRGGEGGEGHGDSVFQALPEPLLLALAAVSTDPKDLRILARLSCDMVFDPLSGEPLGLRYAPNRHGRNAPVIHRHDLFETLVNNPRLPDAWKRALVLRPGVQGDSEIVGDVGEPAGQTHVFEYLRRNSYIPWGHYAANMADDAPRYEIRHLAAADMSGLRHLYYQRTYVRLAEEVGLQPPRRGCLDVDELERLRLSILAKMGMDDVMAGLKYTSTLWGWNYGFDFAPSGYRLHASHQQVHQQYALVPAVVADQDHCAAGGMPPLPSFACGDLVAETVIRYRAETGNGLFEDYVRALRGNVRTDGKPGESSLVVHEDEHVLLFVPKAQTSGWELQLLPVGAVGNILEADAPTRAALDRAILLAQQALERLGARMVTSIEYSRRFDSQNTDQRLLYAFLPKLPYAPGGFSEAQLRHIIGHYPEDFATACRHALSSS